MVNWDEQYPGAREQLPDDMPTPMRKKVTIQIYVDAEHAHGCCPWETHEKCREEVDRNNPHFYFDFCY